MAKDCRVGTNLCTWCSNPGHCTREYPGCLKKQGEAPSGMTSHNNNSYSYNNRNVNYNGATVNRHSNNDHNNCSSSSSSRLTLMLWDVPMCSAGRRPRILVQLLLEFYHCILSLFMLYLTLDYSFIHIIDNSQKVKTRVFPYP